MQSPQNSPPDPIVVVGMDGEKIEIAGVDGNVCVTLAGRVVSLDRPGADDLIHALAATQGATRTGSPR